VALKSEAKKTLPHGGAFCGRQYSLFRFSLSIVESCRAKRKNSAVIFPLYGNLMESKLNIFVKKKKKTNLN
jgi:hypothetical protein